MLIIQSFTKPKLTFILALILTVSFYPQHRGDNLSFQGFGSTYLLGVKPLAMGGAFAAQTGDVASLFYNPAGLADIQKIQLNVAGNYNTNLWREHQQWRPDRLFVTLPFYLSGMAPLDPKYDGQLDTARVRDPNYIVKTPKTGLDPYSKEAADWEKTNNKFALNYFAVAVPFTLFDYKFGAAASYSRQNISDYDRNDTYLNPFIGYFGYGDVPLVTGQNDSLRFSWSKFYRQRFGYLDNIPLGIGCELIDHLKLGIGANISWGKTTDYLALIRIGDFTLIKEQQFKFTHIISDIETNGESTFNSLKFNIGFVYSFDRVNIAMRVDLPYTLTRKWNYNTITSDTSSVVKNESGTDKLKFPAAYTFALNFNPVNKVNVSFDYEYAPFSNASFNMSSIDSTLHSLVNRNSYRFGIEYKAVKWLSILAGYQNVPELFVPDGAANKDRGPAFDSYSFGLSYSNLYGRIDVAYEWKKLKYYDAYYSNTNYQMEITNRIVLGYSYSF